MKKGVSVILFIVILALPIVNATTQINLKTQPTHTAFINVLKPSEAYELIKMYREYTGTGGKISVAYSEQSDSRINILIVLKKDDLRVDSKTFENLQTGGVINLELLPEGWVDPFPEETIQNETNSTNQSAILEPTQLQQEPEVESEQTNPSAEAPITGEVVAKTEAKFSKNLIYYILGALVLGGITIFLIRKKIKANPIEAASKIPKRDIRNIEKELMIAEKKLSEARAEIAMIKNKDKIEEAEKKLKEDSARLENLKRGVDPNINSAKKFTSDKPFRRF